MRYWLFVCTLKKIEGRILPAEEILKQRLDDAFWGLGETTPNRRSLKRGDEIVFYLGQPAITFAASAVLSSDSFKLSPAQQKKFEHDSDFYTTAYGVTLDSIQVFDPPHQVKDLVANLNFIENKPAWYTYLQGGVRELAEEDFRTIVGNQTAPPLRRAGNTDAIASAGEFALEAHLEDFIDKNWKRINFGSQLEKYAVEDQNGRQFPAGKWSIDFLCHDSNSGDLVVIELKRGRSSDEAVGQVLRYIGWVSENLCKSNQKVRGIIISQEADDSLKYAVKTISNVSVLTYKVDFNLFPFKP